MIKDIVVNLSLGDNGGVVANYAVSVAEAFNAHLAGVAFIFDPIVPVSGAGYVPPEVIDIQVADNRSASKDAIDRFSAAASRAGISAEPVSLNASAAGSGDKFGYMARRFDLAIVGQCDPEANSIEEIIAENTLFESGRPMIVVPYIQKGPLKLDLIMVCWDGSRPAARAIADAMPFLEKAKCVELVIVSNDSGKKDEIEGADMGQHLARHGLNVEVKRIDSAGIDIADALLSHAADSGADFIVMGGYGHSRLREFILGGVTKSMLRSLTVPALLSH
jgi:nucleotide-binding universal stress UspA family protein